MNHDRDPNREVREFRLEGFGLFIVGGIFLAALAGAFYLGRWVERRSAPQAVPLAGDLAEPTGAPAPEPAAADQRPDYFDTVEGHKQAEPRREAAVARRPPVEREEPTLPAPAEPAKPAAEPPRGPFYVQVFAGRDRASAQTLVGKLGDKGYRARLDTEVEGDGRLYKVRVGGYATREDAQQLMERLRGEGFPGAWVTRLEG